MFSFYYLGSYIYTVYTKDSADNSILTVLDDLKIRANYLIVEYLLKASDIYFGLSPKVQFSSVQSFFISAICRTKYLHQRNYTTKKGTCNKTKQR